MIYNRVRTNLKTYFFTGHKNVYIGSGRIRNKLAFWILIRFCNAGLRIRGPEEIFPVLFYNSASMLL